jgi:hypothetical protein
MNKDNYYHSSCADFKPCNRKKRIPDVTTLAKRSGCVSSVYWYGTDKNGDYVVRGSAHWGSVSKCFWTLAGSTANSKEFRYGKCYFADMREREYIAGRATNSRVWCIAKDMREAANRKNAERNRIAAHGKRAAQFNDKYTALLRAANLGNVQSFTEILFSIGLEARASQFYDYAVGYDMNNGRSAHITGVRMNIGLLSIRGKKDALLSILIELREYFSI